MDKQIKTFALAGNPNCGKTTLFNSLTGSTAYVGNWPGVTVEKREGTYKNKKVGQAKIIDLPGIYSLSPYTPEEVVSRNFILEEHPDCVINVIDATNLERNLYMTTQILEMDVPVVIALNMADVLKNTGVEIDVEGLSKKLGVPVVSISALRQTNLDELIAVALKASEEKREGQLLWTESNADIENALNLYKEEGVSNPLFHAVKALENDELELQKNKAVAERVKKSDAETDFEAESADLRYKYITGELATFRTGVVSKESNKLSKSDKIDKVLTNKWAAIPILIVIFFLIFHFTFAGDLLYLAAMGVNFGDGYEGAIHFVIDGEEVRPFAGLFYDDAGFASIGEFFHRLVGDNETGILGLICLGIKQGLINVGSPDWVIGFLYDGVLNGIAAVLGFVPQILILFAFFSILEDSGYMARVAFVLDRIFRRFGVSGRAFLPMIMGFGCAVPAIMNTRTLASDKERTKTIRVIPFFTCGAKNEFLLVIAAAVGAAIGFPADLFALILYLLGITAAIVAVIVMNKTTQREKVPPFIMELPSYHLPQFKSLAIHVWDKGKHFLKKAFTIILLSTILVWLFAHIKWDWTYIAEDEEIYNSILGGIGSFLAPIFTPLGFGVQTGTYGWTYAVASIQGIIAKENVTSVIETLAGSYGLADFEALASASHITPAGLTAFAVFNLLTIPCFASVGAAKGELPNKKSYIGTLLFWLGVSYLTGTAVYLVLEYIWPLAIIVPVIAGGVVGIYFYDKHKKKKELEA